MFGVSFRNHPICFKILVLQAFKNSLSVRDFKGELENVIQVWPREGGAGHRMGQITKALYY